MEIGLSELLPQFQIARIIERVGDHSVRIAKNALKIETEDDLTEVYAHIRTASKGALTSFERSIEAFFTHDMKKANKTIESTYQMEDNYSKINEEIMTYPSVLAIPIRNITDSIRRSGEYSADIAENVINYEMLMEETMSNT